MRPDDDLSRLFIALGDQTRRAVLARLAERAENVEPFLKSIGDEFTVAGGIINQRFKEERGPDGESWQPLSPLWIKQREKKMPGSPLSILRMRGFLAGSINYQITGSQLKIGTDSNVDHYAGAHQFGYEEGGIPARPFLGFGDEDMDVIEEEAMEFLSGD